MKAAIMKASTIALVFAASAWFSAPAHAQADVMKACGAEYQTAKGANQLGAKTWNEFLSECRARHAQGSQAPSPQTQPPAAKSAEPAKAAHESSTAVFPTKIDPKFASEKPFKQRQKTCAAQYQANKANNANGGLEYIQKGGGYWSECNKRLKAL